MQISLLIAEALKKLFNVKVEKIVVYRVKR